ncbi:unnamed protein product [Rotaria magnacalcarata]|uniref:Uncharacterized protein n=1 Tax=Rotaria magnacalcarata TaxID=392030 RepID=A0A816PFV1_9BILA|nr:unnamed protein product [Rotaria magnacalcarata]
MIAGTESEFNLFNRIYVARRAYELLHSVGSGVDEANERCTWELANTITTAPDKPITSHVKRNKESDNEDSTDQSAKRLLSTKKTTTTTDDDEITPSPLEDIEDEDVDFSQATSSVHRKIKINRVITEDELSEWLKNYANEVKKVLEAGENFGKARR